MTMEKGNAKEQATIKDLVRQQFEMLYLLNSALDNLVERNPKPECGVNEKPEGMPDNVFDEILGTLLSCQGLINRASEKVSEGISSKVH